MGCRYAERRGDVRFSERGLETPNKGKEKVRMVGAVFIRKHALKDHQKRDYSRGALKRISKKAHTCNKLEKKAVSEKSTRNRQTKMQQKR